MKEIIKDIVEGYREDPKEVIGSVFFMIIWALFLWGSLWAAAIIEGSV